MVGNLKENLSIAILNNDRFFENEKPGSKVDQAKRRLRINVTWENFFFAVKSCLVTNKRKITLRNRIRFARYMSR